MVYKQWNGFKTKEFQLMFLGLKGQNRLRLDINENKLSATDHVKLLGIEIDNKSKLSNHVKKLCSKVNKKVSAFSRLDTYIPREQALIICSVVILSNFNYCPLIWLFCNKGAYKEIGRTHQIFNDCVENSTYPDELKCADVTSLPNKGPTNTRTSFGPISVLPMISKLFERIMDKQIVAYITPFYLHFSVLFDKVTVLNMLS